MTLNKYGFKRAKMGKMGNTKYENALNRGSTLREELSNTEEDECRSPNSKLNPKTFSSLKDASSNNITTAIKRSFLKIKKRPFTKQDMLSSMNRFKACRQAEKASLLETINDTRAKRTIYTSQSQNNLHDLGLMSEEKRQTITFGNLLATSKEERRLLNHEKAIKIWNKRTQFYSRQCKRDPKSLSLMERSDQYAVKIQELDQCSKYSKQCEAADAHTQWICSLRSTTEKDQDRQIFLPLISARVKPFKTEVPIFLKIIDNKASKQDALVKKNEVAKVHRLDITKNKGYIKDLKEKISQKTLKYQNMHDKDGDQIQNDYVTKTQVESLEASSPKVKKIIDFDRVENLSNLFVNGDCKFSLEYEYAKRRGTDGVQMVLDHVIDQSGVGEPDESQEIIEEN